MNQTHAQENVARLEFNMLSAVSFGNYQFILPSGHTGPFFSIIPYTDFVGIRRNGSIFHDIALKVQLLDVALHHANQLVTEVFTNSTCAIRIG
jgi:hypothetical protein